MIDFSQILKDEIQKISNHAMLVSTGMDSHQAMKITHGEKAAQEAKEFLDAIEKAKEKSK